MIGVQYTCLVLQNLKSSQARPGMLRNLVNIFKKRLVATKQLIQMAENTELQNIGEKRAATTPTFDLTEKPKKKKKEHQVTLGKDEGFKRKVALLVAYNGGGYYGVQINRGFKTIESELFPALVNVGAVPQDHVDNITKMWFQRGSRTDKGVSAVGQTFSLKMVIVPDLVSKLNENLPEQIRVLGYIRTTNGFDSKNFCCGRTYMYMTPTFAFAPLEKFITDEYRITEDRLEQVRSILKTYEGTHKFHNFTSGIKYEQACASRYIIKFECSDPYVRDGIEFVTLRVRGQSFMLHQIRKMIGMTIAIVRGFCGESALTKSWEAERVDIPKAPGLGLVLEALHFDGYNKKFGSDGIHAPIDWSSLKETMDEFKEKYIISDIVQQEKKDRLMLNWLQTLQYHNFDETRPEGPQKPWVRTVKLLNSKGGESSPDSETLIEKENKTLDDGSETASPKHAESPEKQTEVSNEKESKLTSATEPVTSNKSLENASSAADVQKELEVLTAEGEPGPASNGTAKIEIITETVEEKSDREQVQL